MGKLGPLGPCKCHSSNDRDPTQLFWKGNHTGLWLDWRSGGYLDTGGCREGPHVPGDTMATAFGKVWQLSLSFELRSMRKEMGLQQDWLKRDLHLFLLIGMPFLCWYCLSNLPPPAGWLWGSGRTPQDKGAQEGAVEGSSG